MGIATFCTARQVGVEFPQSITIASSTFAQVLDAVHGGVVESAGKEKLSYNQLRRGAETQLLVGALNSCPDQLPKDVKKKVSEAYKKLKKNKR